MGKPTLKAIHKGHVSVQKHTVGHTEVYKVKMADGKSASFSVVDHETHHKNRSSAYSYVTP